MKEIYHKTPIYLSQNMRVKNKYSSYIQLDSLGRQCAVVIAPGVVIHSETQNFLKKEENFKWNAIMLEAKFLNFLIRVGSKFVYQFYLK